MTISKRVYMTGLGTTGFLMLLMLLAQEILPSEPRPDAMIPISWRPHHDSGGPEDSGLKTWKMVDWSQFAYVQYVTNPPYLCNSVMLFESLHRLGCKPDRLMMYPSGYSLEDDSAEARLLRTARDEYRVILEPIEVERRTTGHDRKLAEKARKVAERLNLGKQRRGKRAIRSSSLSTSRSMSGPFT